MSAILVFVETAGDGPDRLSAEALGLAGRLAGTLGAEVHAVLVPTAADRAMAEGLPDRLSGSAVPDSPLSQLYVFVAGRTPPTRLALQAEQPEAASR